MLLTELKSRIISIHAPREGGDDLCGFGVTRHDDFNPRPPRGGRRRRGRGHRGRGGISIHAPREGGDKFFLSGGFSRGNFNPRPPRGGRRAPAQRGSAPLSYFNPRPPRGGRLLRYVTAHLAV